MTNPSQPVVVAFLRGWPKPKGKRICNLYDMTSIPQSDKFCASSAKKAPSGATDDAMRKRA